MCMLVVTQNGLPYHLTRIQSKMIRHTFPRVAASDTMTRQRDDVSNKSLVISQGMHGTVQSRPT